MPNVTAPETPSFISAAAVRGALPFHRLVPTLRDTLITGAEAPARQRHGLPAGASLMIMPAWHGRSVLGVKIVTVFPDNGVHGLSTTNSTYLLCDGETGQHLAIIDGNEITSRRAAATSALAGAFLAREDASEMLLVGAGHVAAMLPPAWAVVRAIGKVRVWNRHPARAVDVATQLRINGFNAEVTKDLRAAARTADIVCCTTLSLNPLVSGAWLKPGAHLDLIGGFTPAMREADDEAVTRARLYVDTRSAVTEAGDLSQPIARGVIRAADILGTVQDLCRGTVAGRRGAEEITLFKSVGSALGDLAAATLILDALSG